jgi:hypothetical protein
VHGLLDGLRAGQRAPHERVLAGRLDDVVAEPPELQLHGGLRAVAQAADRLDPRTVEPHGLRLAVRRQRAVRDEHVRGIRCLLGHDRGGVEGLVREGTGEDAHDALPVGAVHRDDGPAAVAPDQQMVDVCLVEGGCHGQEVLDHRLVRGRVPVRQRVLSLADDEVVALEPRARRVRGDEDEFRDVAQQQARVRVGDAAAEGVAVGAGEVVGEVLGLVRHVVECSGIVGWVGVVGTGASVPDAPIVRPVRPARPTPCVALRFPT